jgi:hypothetical protein
LRPGTAGRFSGRMRIALVSRTPTATTLALADVRLPGLSETALELARAALAAAPEARPASEDPVLT